jgi:DNA repair ATPase RecN
MAVKKLNKANSLKQVSQLFLKKDEISKLIQNSYTKLSGEFDYSTRTTIITQIESNLEKLSNVISQLDKLGINVIKQEDYLSNQKDKLINIKEKTEINYKLYQIQNEIEKLLFKTNTDSDSSSKCASINQIKLNLKLYSDYSSRLEKLGFKNDYQKRFYENKVFKLDELRKVYRCK